MWQKEYLINWIFCNVNFMTEVNTQFLSCRSVAFVSEYFVCWLQVGCVIHWQTVDRMCYTLYIVTSAGVLIWVSFTPVFSVFGIRISWCISNYSDFFWTGTYHQGLLPGTPISSPSSANKQWNSPGILYGCFSVHIMSYMFLTAKCIPLHMHIVLVCGTVSWL